MHVIRETNLTTMAERNIIVCVPYTTVSPPTGCAFLGVCRLGYTSSHQGTQVHGSLEVQVGCTHNSRTGPAPRRAAIARELLLTHIPCKTIIICVRAWLAISYMRKLDERTAARECHRERAVLRQRRACVAFLRRCNFSTFCQPLSPCYRLTTSPSDAVHTDNSSRVRMGASLPSPARAPDAYQSPSISAHSDGSSADVNMLFLGASCSGKSTLWNHLKYIHRTP